MKVRDFMLVPQKSNQLFAINDRKSLTDLENFISDHIYRSSQTVAPFTFSSKSTNKKTILLIDDDPDMMRSAGRSSYRLDIILFPQAMARKD